MKEIVKVMLAEGIDENTIHEVLDIISEYTPDPMKVKEILKKNIKNIIANSNSFDKTSGSKEGIYQGGYRARNRASRTLNWVSKRVNSGQLEGGEVENLQNNLADKVRDNIKVTLRNKQLDNNQERPN